MPFILSLFHTLVYCLLINMVEHMVWLICTDYETKTGKNTVRFSQNIHIFQGGWGHTWCSSTSKAPLGVPKVVIFCQYMLGAPPKTLQNIPPGAPSQLILLCQASGLKFHLQNLKNLSKLCRKNEKFSILSQKQLS